MRSFDQPDRVAIGGTPYRCAVAPTWRGACKLSRTILSFSSSDQPSARLQYFEPFDLGTAPITVHKDSSQQHASLGKAAFTGRIRLDARSTGSSGLLSSVPVKNRSGDLLTCCGRLR